MDATSKSSLTFGSFHQFDTTSLHTLYTEITQELGDIEQVFSEYSEDPDTDNSIEPSILRLTQTADAFKFIGCHGATELTYALRDTIAYFHQSESTREDSILNFSEGIMLLQRYIDFVLTQCALAPQYLLEITNKLRRPIGQPPLLSLIHI